jgi:DNA processing protein
VTAFTSISRRDAGYPALLAELHDPPQALYVRGDVDALSEPAVAVVGARSCSAYGAQVARSISRELAGSGVVVVSGLARGVDGEAHRGALGPVAFPRP